MKQPRTHGLAAWCSLQYIYRHWTLRGPSVRLQMRVKACNAGKKLSALRSLNEPTTRYRGSNFTLRRV